MRRRARRKIWPLAKLAATCSRAPVVWLALLDMRAERGSCVLTPTRETLAAATGIRRLPTLSRALTTLENAGWLERVLIPVRTGGVRTATLMRVVLKRAPRMERKVFSTARAAVWNEKCSKGRERKVFSDFPSERGGLNAPALDGAGANRPVDVPPAPAPQNEHSSTRIERERMAKIRAARERETRAPVHEGSGTAI